MDVLLNDGFLAMKAARDQSRSAEISRDQPMTALPVIIACGATALNRTPPHPPPLSPPPTAAGDGAGLARHRPLPDHNRRLVN